jgi:putative tricarboxylic transport membrane protein
MADLEGAAALLGDVAALVLDRLLDGHFARRRNACVVHELRHCQAHRQARRQLRQGEIEGVVAPETAAHAAGTSALLPMLSLGVPGSPTAAVLLGGLLIWGLQPGPLLFVEQKEFVWGLIASMYLGNIFGLLVVLTCVPLFAAILRIPFSIIAPLILVLCAIGAYTVHNSTFDVVMMLVFGVVGYVMKKCNYPLAPMVLAIVLGDKAEENFRQSLLASQGSLDIFWSNALVSSIMALGLIALFWGVIANVLTRLKPRPAM